MIVTLLTDFGTSDYFVGAMKGAVLSVSPEAQVVDITHDIPPHDIGAAAFTLVAAYESFPPGTIHVVVVDPGVGSERRPIVVATELNFFVGPDNGVFGHLYERLRNYRVFHLFASPYFRRGVSRTFDGRDVFAPVAGWLSVGHQPEAMGGEIEDFVRLPFPAPGRSDGGALKASIIHVDRFGNLITNIAPSDLNEDEHRRGVTMRVGVGEVRAARRFYAEGGPGEPFYILGSAGFYEIAVYGDSAARLLEAGRGRTVKVRVNE